MDNVLDMKIARRVAENAVKSAGNIIKENLNRIKKISYKHKRDIATDIDLKCDKLIISIIRKAFPDHSIFSEESGKINGKSLYTWVIDPIDGTLNYSHAQPPFRTAVCLLKNNVSVLSAIFNPVKNELFVAEKGKGAYYNGGRIHVNNNNYLDKCMVMTHLSSKEKYRHRTIKNLEYVFSKVMQIRMFGSGLSALCYIAEGRYEVFYNLVTSPWDILPGALLIEEAGGKVTDINGRRITLNSSSILATNGLVHSKMVAVLKEI